MNALAQKPHIQWSKCYGGIGKERADAAVFTPDSGYLLVGYVSSPPNNGDVIDDSNGNDIWIVKLDKNGVMEWQKTYGGTLYEEPSSVALTPDSGFLISSNAYSKDGTVGKHYGSTDSSDIWILKLDKKGRIEWNKVIGGTGDDYVYQGIVTSGGEYIFAGWTTSVDGNIKSIHGGRDCLVFKLAKDGSLLWENTYGSERWDEANSIVEMPDSSYIFAGYTDSSSKLNVHHFGGYDYYVSRINKNGAIVWQKTFGGSSLDCAISLCRNLDSTVSILGITFSEDGEVTGTRLGGQLDMWLIRLRDSSLLWEKPYGSSSTDEVSTIVPTKDNGNIISGYAGAGDGDVTNFHDFVDAWILKLDKNGRLDWESAYGGSLFDYASFVIPLNNQEYIFGGFTGSTDGDIRNNHGEADMWVVKLGPKDTLSGILNSSIAQTDIKIYPNPANKELRIQFEESLDLGLSSFLNISDISGKILLSQKINSPEIILDLTFFPIGIYLLRYKDKERVWNGKFVKE